MLWPAVSPRSAIARRTICDRAKSDPHADAATVGEVAAAGDAVTVGDVAVAGDVVPDDEDAAGGDGGCGSDPAAADGDDIAAAADGDEDFAAADAGSGST